MSQAVVHGNLLYTSGLVDDSETVAEQTTAILERIDRILGQAGTDKAHILRANIWLTDIDTFEEMNDVWDAWVDKNGLPTRATVESKLAGAQFKVEIAIIAAVP